MYDLNRDLEKELEKERRQRWQNSSKANALDVVRQTTGIRKLDELPATQVHLRR